MPSRALVDHRPWLLAGVIAAVAYYVLQGTIKVEPIEIAIKGAGVGFLAIYALRRAPGADGTLLAVMLALCALADMVLELYFVYGGTVFAAAHAVAITLFLRNRRKQTTFSQNLLALVMVIAVPLIAYYFSDNEAVAVYGAVLGAMAGTAWISRFPRYRVGIGAVLFVASDVLIFSQLGLSILGEPREESIWPGLLVWPLYFAGQLMIATGVTQTLRGETPVP